MRWWVIFMILESHDVSICSQTTIAGNGSALTKGA